MEWGLELVFLFLIIVVLPLYTTCICLELSIRQSIVLQRRFVQDALQTRWLTKCVNSHGIEFRIFRVTLRSHNRIFLFTIPCDLTNKSHSFRHPKVFLNNSVLKIKISYLSRKNLQSFCNLDSACSLVESNAYKYELVLLSKIARRSRGFDALVRAQIGGFLVPSSK